MTEAGLHKTLLDHLNNAVVVVDSRCHIQYLNQAAQSVLGLSSSRAEDLDISTMLTKSTDDRSSLMEALEARSAFTKREANIRDDHGKQATIDFSVTPFELANEPYFVIEIQEINRLLRISREESIRTTQESAQQLVRGLAHEIKNPLGGIRGSAQLLEGELDNPELKEYTGIITDEADRLRNLVDQLLGPNSPPSLVELNIHKVLEHVVSLVSAEEQPSGQPSTVTIIRDYDPSLPDIEGDNDQLIQAVLNVARNAMQAMLESGVEDPKLIVRTRIQRRFTIDKQQHVLVARIDFEDNGPGVPPDLIDEIFYPMITGRPQGTGLGLPLAQSIINRHSGLIECTSEPGKTTFSIFIPIATNSKEGEKAEMNQTKY